MPTPEPPVCDVVKKLRYATELGFAVALFAAVISSGCYRYSQVEPRTIRQGESVRVILSGTALEGVSPATTRRNDNIEAELVSLTSDSAAVAVWIGQDYRGTRFQAAHQTLRIPRDGIVQFQRRELSAWRTALAAAAVTGAVVALIRQVGFNEGRNSDNGSEPPPPPPPGGGVSIRIRGGLRMVLGR